MTVNKTRLITSTSKLHDGPSFNKPLTDKIEPLQFTLKDISKTSATAIPVFDHSILAISLIDFLKEEFNYEIENGDTYPQLGELSRDDFIHYWFHSFAVIAIKGTNLDIIFSEDTNWSEYILGTFYIKPNYMPRCSHNCNAGFLVNHNLRGFKIGYRLGQIYVQWAPLLGYTYSVFNLVFVTNQASWRIWDKFKFDRIGMVPKAAVLKGHKEPIDAIIFGKDLTKIEPEILQDFE
ncbi:hypothetical protein KAFR_0A03800 [Kazachstania africana CBS 2517]|uniref:N-acetyltransferase domain-containing protein n=1 Tax=Kazachstania africana (strain ATCC 22294 / BCRC 22015 / CBS 2517 / CECT 1963 / NBRC 1671 / NRRL Y-8276) TaxID=1071382 RepID=H2AN65_KAZAF|nr:hypothetical protein KAFR_0A03800 [Kazachstania africana CBS 2517]CCF55815.1 hypothetical protein KAFR_0A03800 [Kazachstania africana CBS 2517]